MVKILHTADLHLGSTFYKLDNEKANIRKQELTDTFDEIIETVKREGVKYLLIPGDLFDNCGSLKTAEYVSAKFGEIPDVRVFIAAGNHDPKQKLYDLVRWSDNVHIFGEALEAVELDDCVVWGASFLSDYQRMPLLYETETGDKVNILVMHGDFADGAYNLLDRELFRSFDYTALGHIHKYTGIERIGSSYFAYSGTPAARGFDEEGENGFLIGTVDKGVINFEYRHTDTRKYITLRYDLGEFTDNTSLAEQIKRDIDERNLYKIKLVGECNFPLSVEYVERLVEEFCFYVTIRNNTEERINYREYANDYSLMGIFVSNMLEKIDNEESPVRKSEYERVLRCGVMALSGRGDLFD